MLGKTEASLLRMVTKKMRNILRKVMKGGGEEGLWG